jgi:3-phosphoshikimate 1-carboxyvinyltransferase
LKCLLSKDKILNTGQGATTLRFLMAYFAVNFQNKILYCNPSLQIRPIKPLIKILEEMGCTFKFLDQEYSLPLEINGGILSDPIKQYAIDTSISSQFISAILLIAPCLNDKIHIQLNSSTVSTPYIQMTVSEDQLTIHPTGYNKLNYLIEADWSAAVFFYSLLAIKKQDQYHLRNLKDSSLQGDQIIKEFFYQFGIKSTIREDGITIFYEPKVEPEIIKFDFINNPDLFPSIAILCAILKIRTEFTGLKNLVHKESNRLSIICDFLRQQNVIIEFNDSEMNSASFSMNQFNTDIPEVYESFEDHRIAMSFSLLNTIKPIRILNPQVVTKSFPEYWTEFKKIIN